MVVFVSRVPTHGTDVKSIIVLIVSSSTSIMAPPLSFINHNLDWRHFQTNVNLFQNWKFRLKGIHQLIDFGFLI